MQTWVLLIFKIILMNIFGIRTCSVENFKISTQPPVEFDQNEDINLNFHRFRI
jgi:hypothetical protein